MEHTCEHCGKTDNNVEVFDENMVVISGVTYIYLHPECLEEIEKVSGDKK